MTWSCKVPVQLIFPFLLSLILTLSFLNFQRLCKSFSKESVPIKSKTRQKKLSSFVFPAPDAFFLTLSYLSYSLLVQPLFIIPRGELWACYPQTEIVTTVYTFTYSSGVIIVYLCLGDFLFTYLRLSSLKQAPYSLITWLSSFFPSVGNLLIFALALNLEHEVNNCIEFSTISEFRIERNWAADTLPRLHIYTMVRAEPQLL